VNQASEKRLALVYPVLAGKIRLLDGQVQKETGDVLIVTQGVRVTAEQAALFAQGRQDTASVNLLRSAVGWAPITDAENHKVTNAPPGYSYHELGMAVDVAPKKYITDHGWTVDWDQSHPVWQKIVELGQNLGMVSGVSWKDEPHFQMTGRFPVGAPDVEARTLFKEKGMAAVWAAAY
jgi:hypothetical protein